jgi:hypothetical protein
MQEFLHMFRKFSAGADDLNAYGKAVWYHGGIQLLASRDQRVTDQPILRRLDHVNIVVPNPRALFDFLTDELRIPIERPWARFPAFESGQAMLGIGHEPITYAPGRQTRVRSNAGLFALAFEPEPLKQARRELARREIPHSIPLEFSVTYRDHSNAFALDELAGPGQRRRRWTLITLGGLFGNETSARELQRWPRRGDGFGADWLGRALGRVASGSLGGPFMARLGSVRPFAFLCHFKSFDVAESRTVAASELVNRGGGPLGLLGTREIIVSARDLRRERHRWQQVLLPAQPDDFDRWELGDGPALRLVAGSEDAIQTVIWEVSSLDRAADWLRGKGWLKAKHDNDTSIAPEPLQGLDVRLAQRI